jgi:hypothetical protein
MAEAVKMSRSILQVPDGKHVGVTTVGPEG